MKYLIAGHTGFHRFNRDLIGTAKAPAKTVGRPVIRIFVISFAFSTILQIPDNQYVFHQEQPPDIRFGYFKRVELFIFTYQHDPCIVRRVFSQIP